MILPGIFNNKIFLNASRMTILQIAGDMAGFLLYIVYSRYYGPEGIGLYAYAFALAGIVSSVINAGLEDYGIRECILKSPVEKLAIIGNLAVTQLFITLITFMLMMIFLIGSKTSAEALMVILSLTIYQSLSVLARTFFIPSLSRQEMFVPALAEFLCKILAAVISIIFVVALKLSLAKAIIAFPVLSIFFITYAVKFTNKKFGKIMLSNIKIDELFFFVKAVWPFAVSILVSFLYARMGVLLITYMISDRATGIFASALKMLEVGIMPVVYLVFASYPSLSRTFSDDAGEFAKRAGDLFTHTALAGIILGWGLYFIAPDILIPLLGPKFSESADVIRLVAAAGFLMPLTIFNHRLMLAAHLQRERLYCQVAGAIIGILLNILMITLFSLNGAVIALIISELMANAILMATFRRKLPAQASVLGKKVLRYAVFILALSGSTLSVGYFARNVWLPAIFSLALIGLAAYLTWSNMTAIMTQNKKSPTISEGV